MPPRETAASARRRRQLTCFLARLSTMPPKPVAASDRALLRSVASGRRFYHDRPGHVRMQRAEILVSARRRERERISVSGVQGFRLELLADRGDRMRDVVLVGPGDGRAGLDRQFLRIEGEVVDADGPRRILRAD